MRPEQLTDDDQTRFGQPLQREAMALELMKRPELDYAGVCGLSVVGAGRPTVLGIEQAEQVALALDVEAKYAGYIERQQREIARHAKQESLELPADIDYATVTGLSTEARQRLETVRPLTLGQASRLEGVTPSTISLLLIHLKKRSYRRSA